MAVELTIKLPLEAVMAIEAAKDNKVETATNAQVAAAVVDAIDARSKPHQSKPDLGPVAQQKDQRDQNNIVLKYGQVEHRLVVPHSATLKDLRSIIAGRTAVQPLSQSRLFHDGAQIGGYGGNDGSESNTALYQYGIRDQTYMEMRT